MVTWSDYTSQGVRSRRGLVRAFSPYENTQIHKDGRKTSWDVFFSDFSDTWCDLLVRLTQWPIGTFEPIMQFSSVHSKRWWIIIQTQGYDVKKLLSPYFILEAILIAVMAEGTPLYLYRLHPKRISYSAVVEHWTAWIEITAAALSVSLILQ